MPAPKACIERRAASRVAACCIGLEETNGTPAGLAAELKQLADSNKIQINTDFSAALLPRSYLPPPPHPAKQAHIGIATDWPDTPAELIDNSDLSDLKIASDLRSGKRRGSSAFGRRSWLVA